MHTIEPDGRVELRSHVQHVSRRERNVHHGRTECTAREIRAGEAGQDLAVRVFVQPPSLGSLRLQNKRLNVIVVRGEPLCSRGCEIPGNGGDVTLVSER